MTRKLLLQLPLKLLGEGIMILFFQLWEVDLFISFIPLKYGLYNLLEENNTQGSLYSLLCFLCLGTK